MMPGHQNCNAAMINLGYPLPQQKFKQPSAIPQSGDKDNTSKSESTY